MKLENNSVVYNTLKDGYDFFIEDKWGKEYHFRISTFPVPSGLESEAIEVVEKGKGLEPYTFQVLEEYDEDIEELELLLKAKIQKGINKRYLATENGKPVIGADQELAGRISYYNDPKNTALESMFIIDGKRITMEQFMEMLQAYEGFQFKFSIHDPVDEIPD